MNVELLNLPRRDYSILRVVRQNVSFINFKVVVGKVMFVHIILRGLNIERVFVRGLDEEDGMDGLDLFTESQYAVMRMVTQHTTAASLYYYHSNTYQNNPDTVLRMFLAWLR